MRTAIPRLGKGHRIASVQGELKQTAFMRCPLRCTSCMRHQWPMKWSPASAHETGKHQWHGVTAAQGDGCQRLRWPEAGPTLIRYTGEACSGMNGADRCLRGCVGVGEARLGGCLVCRALRDNLWRGSGPEVQHCQRTAGHGSSACEGRGPQAGCHR